MHKQHFLRVNFLYGRIRNVHDCIFLILFVVAIQRSFFLYSLSWISMIHLILPVWDLLSFCRDPGRGDALFVRSK